MYIIVCKFMFICIIKLKKAMLLPTDTYFFTLRKMLLVAIGLIFFITNGSAQLRLPSFFTDGMVLKQNSQVTIWGKDLPNTKIFLRGSWGSKVKTSTDASGSWKVKLSTTKAGGPYELSIKGSRHIRIKDVLLGEVWFCSGQSNMEMPLKGRPNEPVNGSNTTIAHANHPKLRLFTVERNRQAEPADDVTGKWESCTSKTAKEFSAVAYYFAEEIMSHIDVPIGLISSTWGGTGSEAWTDNESLASFTTPPSVDSIKSQLAKNKMPATVLYNGMVHPFLEYAISGVIWYQGENNKYSIRAAQYKDAFPAMIKGWRTRWKQGDFPFYFVQIAPFQTNRGNAALVREGQLQTMQNVINTGMVVTLDVGNCDNIHPPEKKIVGQRLAYWALAKTYGHEGIDYCGPIYKDYAIDRDSVIITFDNAEMGLTSFGEALTGFKIAGADSIFHDAKVEILNDENIAKIKVYNSGVKNPISVRYAFDHCIKGSLFNTAALPASPFRTDRWKE
jgi:sialate O-acetylesterase